MSANRIIITEPNGVQRSRPITARGLTVGRGNENDLVINYAAVSREHALISYDRGRYHVTDLNSGNGTYLGEARLASGKPTPWPHGQTLRIGEVLIHLEQAQTADARSDTMVGWRLEADQGGKGQGWGEAVRWILATVALAAVVVIVVVVVLMLSSSCTAARAELLPTPTPSSTHAARPTPAPTTTPTATPEPICPLPDLAPGQHISASGSYTQTETEAAGPMICRIQPGSCAHRSMVGNLDPSIVFKREEEPPYDREDILMHPDMVFPLYQLKELVEAEWGGAVRLRVTDAYDSLLEHDLAQMDETRKVSLHFEGRSIDLTTWPLEPARYGRLCALAHCAGFDWVHHEGDHCHASIQAESLCLRCND